MGETFSEIVKTIMYIFMNGPLKVYLEIKEGKTSAKKLIEEYEDDRSKFHEKLGLKRPDLLPARDTNTTSSGLRKRNVHKE